MSDRAASDRATDGEATGDRGIGVDVGGTFTDVALSLDGDLVTAKVPSTDDQSEGVAAGIEKACEAAGIDPGSVREFSHAMTVSVNALLEGDGARTALVTTEGFRDVLEIGRQTRPSLYDLDAEKPAPLVPRRRRFEVAERTSPDGVERPVDDAAIESLVADLRDADVESVAVCLLHAYAHPENEERVAEALRAALDVPVSASHEVLPEFREYERTSTTAVDAYVRPAIDGYVGRLTERARDMGLPQPRIMQANGGVTDADTVRRNAVTTVLSGPAAGVVGASATASAADRDGLITFDMGGTSSDVSLVRDGEVERTTESAIADRPIGTPMVDVETVGAGGGSIAWVDSGGALRIGPRSAGAEPGPACYGKGGTEPTVTDANLVLGYVGADTSLGGDLSLDAAAARALDIVLVTRHVDGKRRVTAVGDFADGDESGWTELWSRGGGDLSLDGRLSRRLASRTDQSAAGVETDLARKRRYVEYLVDEELDEHAALFDFLADLYEAEAATIERVGHRRDAYRGK